MNNIYESLERIEQLRKQGILTQEEFEQEKRRLLSAGDASKQQTPPQSRPTVRNAAIHDEESGYNLQADTQQNGSYALAVHLVMFVPYIGWLISLIMWLTKKNESPLVNQHGAQLMNMVISQILYTVVFAVIAGVIIGVAGRRRFSNDFPPEMIPVIIVGAAYVIYLLVCVVYMIVNAVRASSGKAASYPLSIPFINTKLPQSGDDGDISRHFGR